MWSFFSNLVANILFCSLVFLLMSSVNTSFFCMCVLLCVVVKFGYEGLANYLRLFGLILSLPALQKCLWTGSQLFLGPFKHFLIQPAVMNKHSGDLAKAWPPLGKNEPALGVRSYSRSPIWQPPKLSRKGSRWEPANLASTSNGYGRCFTDRASSLPPLFHPFACLECSPSIHLAISWSSYRSWFKCYFLREISHIHINQNQIMDYSFSEHFELLILAHIIICSYIFINVIIF